MSKLFAIVVPIVPGKEAQFKSFISELQKRQAEFNESRTRLKVHERTFHQVTPMGEFVIVTLEGEDPQTAFQNFSAGDDDFTRWFIKNVNQVHGIDLAQPPPGPLPVLIADSHP